MNQINNMSGQSFKNKVYNMLLSIGVSAETLNTVIANLTEGTPAQNNNDGQIVATADKFVASGTTLQTTEPTDRSHPDNYYVLNSSSQNVSYTFTATKAYTGQIVAYLGNTESSSSKYIYEAISCQLDSSDVYIQGITYADAGMGKCSSRMNYYPVVLGNVEITEGSHTIRIFGNDSATMNIGTICIFDAATAAEIQGGGSGEGGEHTHRYIAQSPATNKAGKSVTTYLCDCGKKYIGINFTDWSSMTGTISSNKISDGAVIKWDIPAKAGNVDLVFNMKVSNSNHITNTEAVFRTANYTFKINGVEQTILLPNDTQYGSLGLDTNGQYFAVCSFEIENDMNIEIEFDHNNDSYRLIFGEQVRLMYQD